ncbi:MAG: serine/threonine-protein kinase [Planctomycetota bacterium]|nr:serine/threonine-protein kinase [Planctomycetota bacterium]
MPAPNADSNLLFGMTALQMDFITRDALLAAMQAWTFDKQRQLGDILIEQGVLTDSQRALLKELVQEHLKQHGDDPQKSLAAIRADSSIGEALQSIDDRDVHESLIHFAITRTPDMYATRQANETSDDGQRFRILRPHAQGGLGQISVAFDKELHREVALKELQMKYAANEATRERFMIEAEITGGLEHPSIIPVYGLGHYSDGRPYYAMRFIRGDNLQEAIDAYHRSPPDARHLELHKLLRRFVDVCDAVQYAHSRGVLHRDLKPGNIMLGKYGETLLVDWGLAKPIDSSNAPTLVDGPPLHISSGSGSAPTSMGSVVGTPGYMSPEQAAGRLDLLGPASDVYGLGATLYHLLTGQAPFHDKLSEVLKKIERGEFQPPRQVNSKVPRALEEVCLKAMQRRPEDRYTSASRLAEDVEHWLADEPVSTWKEPVSQRLRRWTRRHWNATVGLAAIVVAGLAMLAVSAVVLRRAYDHEQQQHAVVRQVVDDYFTEVSEATLLNQPGSQPLRRELLQRALKYYEDFAKEHSRDSEARDELGKAHYRIGIIKEAVGSAEDSLAAFDRAIALQRTLAEEQPALEDRLHALGLSLNARGRLLYDMGTVGEAIDALQQAITVRTRLTALATDNAEFARVLANSHMNLGECFRIQRKEREARGEFVKAQAIREPWRNRADNVTLQRDLAKGSYNLGNLEADTKNDDAAATSFSNAITNLATIRNYDPGDLEVAEMLAISNRRMADLEQASDRNEAALAHYVAALAIGEPLAGNNPSVRQYQATRAGILMNYAGLLAKLDRVDEAVATYGSARDALATLAEQYPTALDYQLDLAATLANLGRLYLWLERPGDAADPLQSAMTTVEHITAAEFAVRTKWVRSVSQFNVGRYLWATVSEPEAVATLAASHVAVSQLANEFPNETRYATQRDEAALEFFAAHFAASKIEGSASNDEEAMEFRLETIRKQLPADELSRRVAARLQSMARLQWAASQPQRARGTMQLACDRWRTLTQDLPDDAASVEQLGVAQGDLGAILLDIGAGEMEAGNATAARDAYQQARDVLAPLVLQHPDDEFYRRDFAAAEKALREIKLPESGD